MITFRQIYKQLHGHAFGVSPGNKTTERCDCPGSAFAKLQKKANDVVRNAE